MLALLVTGAPDHVGRRGAPPRPAACVPRPRPRDLLLGRQAHDWSPTPPCDLRAAAGAPVILISGSAAQGEGCQGCCEALGARRPRGNSPGCSSAPRGLPAWSVAGERRGGPHAAGVDGLLSLASRMARGRMGALEYSTHHADRCFARGPPGRRGLSGRDLSWPDWSSWGWITCWRSWPASAVIFLMSVKIALPAAGVVDDDPQHPGHLHRDLGDFLDEAVTAVQGPGHGSGAGGVGVRDPRFVGCCRGAGRTCGSLRRPLSPPGPAVPVPPAT